MTKKAVSALNKVHAALQGLEKDEQLRTIQAVVVLLGHDKTLTPANQTGTPTAANLLHQQHATTVGSAQQYFRQKGKVKKVQQLALAVRFLELTSPKDAYSKEEIAGVYSTARINFDSANFSRDIGNARVAGLFNKGDAIVLSDYGQQVADALPDKAAIKALVKPTIKRASKAGKAAKKQGKI